ncbi:MAG: hypothetical protein FWE39_06990 [Nocardiaceae bacterium]|nr:hypothetical protein [Nocardiaceae bacterium]
MKRISRLGAASIVGATGIATILAGGGVANAYNVIPGADDTGNVVVTGVDDLAVTVTTSEDGTQVTVAVANTGTRNFVCAGPNGNATTSGDVTEAAIVAQAMDYYRNQLNRQPGNITVKLTGLGGSTNTVSTGSVEGFLPGGQFGSLFGEAFAARDEIRTAQGESRLAGHAADIPKFNINAGGAYTTTVTLGDPSVGPRKAFDAGAFLYCTSGSDHFAFAGYENGEPVDDGGNGSLGSATAPDSGSSWGSVTSPTGS